MNLRDIHTKLSWTRKHRKTSGFKQRDLEDITQILNEEQLGEDGPVRILVQGKTLILHFRLVQFNIFKEIIHFVPLKSKLYLQLEVEWENPLK